MWGRLLHRGDGGGVLESSSLFKVCYSEKEAYLQLLDVLAFWEEFHLRERILLMENLKCLQTIG